MAGLLGSTLPVAGAVAQNLERPPSFDPARIAGIVPAADNYTIAKPVQSDGFMRIYAVKSSYGDFIVISDQLMRVRQVELAALAALERVSSSEQFNKALVDAGLSPVKYAGDLITKPGETISNTLSGIGSLFGQIGSSMNNAGKTPDDPMQSLLGVTKKKRELAIHLGVDPYTDYEPLQAKLTQLSEAAAAGGLVVTGALMAIPGVGGIVASNVYTGGNLATLARDLSAAQLMDLNRRKLAAMGVEANVAETLLTNRSFTPLDTTAIVSALDSMSAVQNRSAFVGRAASVHRHDAAFFMRQQAELTGEYYAKTGGIVSFVTLGGYPFAVGRNGGVIGILPINALSWTANTAQSMKEIVDGAKRGGYANAELRITGQATTLAKQQLQSLGWKVVENYKP
ncbi:MAG: hypothetical protein ACXWJW_04700 [Xanthobacteraceae bacterium]